MAKIALKPLGKQVVVITGATSGIGLATVRLLASRGARLFLIARNADALAALRTEIRAMGGQAEFAVADVSDHAALQAASDAAVAAFGGYDTWVNDAGAFIYGRLDDVPLQDQRRLLDVVYWGVVHGTLIAGAALKAGGGAIVNVGSVLGEIAIPYQGSYCAAKFAVKGFTEAYRRELAAERTPVAVSLIKPAAINTPFMEHARNHIGAAGTRNPPPAYDPHLVARAIAHAAEHPTRDLTVGGAGGVALVVANRLAPALVDWVSARTGRFLQTTKDAGDPARRDNLYTPREDGAESSTLGPFTRKTSLALEAQLHPGLTALGLAGVAFLVHAATRRRSRRLLGRG